MELIGGIIVMIAGLTMIYSGVAYRHDGLPSPLPSRHDRALARIAVLERELDIGQPPKLSQAALDYRDTVYRVTVDTPPTMITRNPYRLPTAGARPFGTPSHSNAYQQDYRPPDPPAKRGKR